MLNPWMKAAWERFVPQPLIAVTMGVLALGLMGLWIGMHPHPMADVSLQAILLALLLGSATCAAGKYPIHLRPRVKVLITTIPLYLTAILLPPLLAALTAGLSILAVEATAMAKKGNLPCDVATAASRWTIVALLSAWVAHLPTSGESEQLLVLVGTALVMFTGDVVTVSFEIVRMGHEAPWHLMRSLVQEGGWIEGVQYLIGMLGALAARQQVWALVLLSVPTAIVYLAFKNLKEMREGTRRLLESMADTVDLRDAYTGGHSLRVADLASKTLRAMNIAGPESDLIVLAARVHDIGKIGIPDDILRKEGKLTPEEWEVMKAHPDRGADLLIRYADFSRGRDFVRYHHERWDGQGYPRGLKGEEIPLGARVLAVVDAFDAMTSDRPYRRAMTTEQGIQILQAGRGHQWDPHVVDAFLRSLAPHLAAPALSHRLPAQPLIAPAAE